MEKLLFLALIPFLFSCKDGKNPINEIPDQFHSTGKLAGIDTLHLYDNVLKVDTLVFEKFKKLNIADKVLAVALKTGYSKDSIEITSCRLDFYLKNKLLQCIPVNTYTSHEDPMWSLYEDVFINGKSKKADNRFFEISYGVPACGFTQSNFLLFVENHDFQLVSKYDSVGDGPYSDYFGFEPHFVGDTVLYFTSKRIVVSGDESKPYNEENEDFVIAFSDSTLYTLNHGKWSGKLKTPKGKPFRKEFKTYRELFPPE
ncbi:hypothetical protein L1S35_08470 [Flavobacterium sp. AS60]|uniref:hypothetical protein n=1 Tax=Flavobacterium anseongense TaxID=2910677 RepID=UPI001F4185B7|nr:hypothetical protein [Flavobacterium sp. AS60]MCF6129705.1 hypothetical protein [Flavobacterium sp. AS60]